MPAVATAAMNSVECHFLMLCIFQDIFQETFQESLMPHKVKQCKPILLSQSVVGLSERKLVISQHNLLEIKECGS